VALHFPPFYPSHRTSPYRVELERHGVLACVYGHLHGEAAAAGPVGRYGDVEYFLVAADAVGFRPVLVATGGQIVPAGKSDHEGKAATGPHVEDGRERFVEGRAVTETDSSSEELRRLAEAEIAEKRDELGNEEQARKLYDLATETPAELEQQQDEERRR
jgi:hypothetical protein